MKTKSKVSTFSRKQFDEILEAEIAQEKADIAEHDEIKAIILPLVGKLINGQTLNKKRLGDKFSFITKYQMYYIKGERHEHLIGYVNSENIIAVDPIPNVSRGFEYLDACCGRAARERIAQIEAIDRDKAFKLFQSIAKHFNELRYLFGDIENQKFGSFYFPAYYRVLYSIMPKESDKNIKLTDFYFIRQYR